MTPAINDTQLASDLSRPVATAGADPLAAKIGKALTKSIDDDNELLAALSDASTLIADNSVSTRRNLRCAIERRSVDLNRQFIVQLSSVKDVIDELHRNVDKMASDCGALCESLADNRRRGGRLIAATSQLRSESDKLSMRRQLLAAYTRRFQLTQEERGSLRKMPPGETFFAALERAGQIHADCRQLLPSVDRKNTLLEILEQMSLYQEAAYDSLYNWAKKRVCRGELAIDAPLVKSMSCLHKRPTLFQHVIDDYTKVRRQLLVEQFIDALTTGGRRGSGSGGRPIELHAHNSQRYVGDMLAWLHQTAPGEVDSIGQLLAECLTNPASSVSTEEVIDTAVAAVWTDVCRPLSSRIEQVLAACDNVSVLRHLATLLDYYRQSALPAAVGNTGSTSGDDRRRLGALADTLQQLQSKAAESYMKALRTNTAKLCDRIEPSDQSTGVGETQSDSALKSQSADAETQGRHLQPVTAFNSCLQLLHEALDGGDVSGGALLEDTVECVVEQLVSVLAVSAAPLSVHDACVYQLNSLYQLHDQLLQLVAADNRWLQLVKQRLHVQLERLVSEQASSIVDSLGLAEVYAVIEQQQQLREQGSNASIVPLSQIPTCGESAVRQLTVRLDVFLSDPLQLQLPQLRYLMSVQQRVTIRKRAAAVLLVVYERVYEAVHDPYNGYERPDSLLTRTPEQLRSLLDC